jgi:hypothetical protein
MLMQARAEQFYLSFVTSSDTAPEQMRKIFAEEDTRLAALERPGLAQTARCSPARKCAGYTNGCLLRRGRWS